MSASLGTDVALQLAETSVQEEGISQLSDLFKYSQMDLDSAFSESLSQHSLALQGRSGRGPCWPMLRSPVGPRKPPS
jgi:aminopeptidase C